MRSLPVRPRPRATVPAAVLAILLCGIQACNDGLKPEPTTRDCPVGICGTVRFAGAVPDSTDYVRVVVYANVPTTPAELFSFAGFSDPLPLGVDSAFYTCCLTPLQPGTYRWVLVLWKKAGVLDPTTALDLLRETGSYRNPSDTTQLGAVAVTSGTGTPGIDIVTDFRRMRSISDFFPPGSR